MDVTVQYRCPHWRTIDERVCVLADGVGLCRRTFWLGPLSRLAPQGSCIGRNAVGRDGHDRAVEW
jgi:hypothetical protein